MARKLDSSRAMEVQLDNYWCAHSKLAVVVGVAVVVAQVVGMGRNCQASLLTDVHRC